MFVPGKALRANRNQVVRLNPRIRNPLIVVMRKEY
jgi:hypothetical protein